MFQTLLRDVHKAIYYLQKVSAKKAALVKAHTCLRIVASSAVLIPTVAIS
jgi:hypothetical protein